MAAWSGWPGCDHERVWQEIAYYAHRTARYWLPIAVGLLFLIFQKQLAGFVRRHNIRGQGFADTNPQLFFCVGGLVFLALGVTLMVVDLQHP